MSSRRSFFSTAVLVPWLLYALGCNQTDPKTEQAQQALARLTARRASPKEKEEATEQLQAIGDPAIPVLEEAFFSDDLAIGKIEIAIALGGLGPDAIPALTRALETEDMAMVSDALAGLRVQGTRAVPVLVKALSTVSSERHRAILETLGRLGPSAVSAVPTICQSLSAENELIRSTAAKALEQMGPAAKDALAKLEQHLQSEQVDHVHHELVKAALAVGTADAVSLVTPLFASEERGPRCTILVAKLGKAAVPGLLEALEDPNPMVRYRSVMTLSFIGSPAKSAVLALKQRLQSESDARVRAQLQLAIERLSEQQG